MRPPDGLRPYIDEMGTWVVGLAFFSLGIDGLALMIGAKCQGAAFVAIPLLLAWQAALLLLFFRSVVPAFERLPEGRGDLRAIYAHAFRLATVAPAIAAIVAWTLVSALAHARR
ncbi:MAG TPA: hypothetical protein VGS20_14900 [Candidatus Acidoferrales bacterium]|nr:hypothetical protein [Candidatus Acidoferrales bacterium]